MKLFYSKTSPYARRIRMGLEVLGLVNECELIEVSPFDVPAELIKYNPLSQIPTLITDQGQTITGSANILEYINLHSQMNNLFPKESYWHVRHFSNVAEGIVDAALSVVLETRRESNLISQSHIQNQKEKIQRSVNYLEVQKLNLDVAKPDALAISLVMALGYLDFRIVDLDWRASCSNLSNFYEKASQQSWVQNTAPPNA